EVAAAEEDLLDAPTERLSRAPLVGDLHRAAERREGTGHAHAHLGGEAGHLLQIELDATLRRPPVREVLRPALELGAKSVAARWELAHDVEGWLGRERRLAQVDADVIASHDIECLGRRARAPLGVAAGGDDP